MMTEFLFLPLMYIKRSNRCSCLRKLKVLTRSQSRPLRHLVGLDIKPQCQQSSVHVSFQHPLTFSKRPSPVLYRPAYTIHEIHNWENIISLYSNYIYPHINMSRPGNTEGALLLSGGVRVHRNGRGGCRVAVPLLNPPALNAPSTRFFISSGKTN